MLFKALTLGPAYLIFPIVSISPAITVLMALVFLRERLSRLAVVGLIAALAAIVLFSVTGDTSGRDRGPWLLLALVVCVAWGVQAFFMRKAATQGVNDATTFGWMAISGPAARSARDRADGRHPHGRTVAGARARRRGTQLLNAVGALFLVMALSRGKASVVSPVTNALAPVLTIIVSLVFYQTLPTPFGAIGIVLALGGSTLMVYADEKRGEDVAPGAVAEAAAEPRSRVSR